MVARRRLVMVVGWCFAFIAGGGILYTMFVLRYCGEQTRVSSDSLLYQFCGIRHELVASVPVDSPVSTPLYSWRETEGTKPTIRRLEYTSRDDAATIRRHLQAFLVGSAFARQKPDPHDPSFEWWADGKQMLGFGLTAGSDSAPTQVEIIVDRGLE